MTLPKLTSRKRLVAFGIIGALCLTGALLVPWRPPSGQSPLPADLDSLVFDADSIVEGRMCRTPEWGFCLRVTKVLKGTIASGNAVCPVNLADSQRPGTYFRTQYLEEGDHVLLFLQDGPSQPRCIDGGMFFELRGRMAPFGAGPPMGTLTWIPPGVDKHSSRSSDMRKAIAANVVRTARWHSLLEPPADRAKSDLYLGVLKARAKPTARFAVYGIGPTDWIASAAASRLDEIGDRDLALRALYADPSRASAFQNLFATREGREFLLKRLTDRSIPLDRRLAMSKELQFCLFQYFKEAVHAERNPREAQAAPAPDPGFVTGLAKAAVASHDNEEPLSAEILRDIVEFLPWTFNGGVTAIQPDLDRAGNILEPLMLDPSASARVRYWGAKGCLCLSATRPVALIDTVGPIPTLARPPEPPYCWLRRQPSIFLDCEWSGLAGLMQHGPRRSYYLPSSHVVDGVYVVVEPVKGGKSYLIPSGIPFPDPGSQAVHSDSVPLPAGLTPGRYRLHYRLMHGGAVLGDGFGFETTLPQPQIPPPNVATGLHNTKFNLPAWRTSWSVALGAFTGVTLLVWAARRIWRSRRRVKRFRRGECHACGYDLRASGGRCPECGTVRPETLPVQVLRRRLLRTTGAGLMLFAIFAAVLGIRSYFTGDVLVRTTIQHAEAIYVSRGVAVCQWLTPGSELGWSIDHVDPADLPTDAGSLEGNRVFGFGFSPHKHTAVVPIWFLLVATLGVGVLLLRPRAKRLTLNLTPRSQPTTEAGLLPPS